MTAIATARLGPRIKACVTLDPWPFVYRNEINSNQFQLNVAFCQPRNSTHFVRNTLSLG